MARPTARGTQESSTEIEASAAASELWPQRVPGKIQEGIAHDHRHDREQQPLDLLALSPAGATEADQDRDASGQHGNQPGVGADRVQHSGEPDRFGYGVQPQ